MVDINFLKNNLKMKKIIYSICLMAIITSCERQQLVKDPSVNIKLVNPLKISGDTLIYKLSDTCKFAFTNSADNITFYSGEGGYNYEYRNRTKAKGDPILSFTTRMRYGTQNKSLEVYASSKLSSLDSAVATNVNNWTNITDRVKFPTVNSADANSLTYAVNSGEISLSDILKTENDSLVIGFRYIGDIGSTQKTWYISNYFLYNTVNGVKAPVSSLLTEASLWKKFKLGNTSTWTISSSLLSITGDGIVKANEAWIISHPIFMNEVNPDVPKAILKSFNSTDVTNYEYKYASVGVYKATFVANNITADDKKENVKTFIIKVIP